LLREYRRLFKEKISAGDVRLVVVGYGFGDPHINKDLLEGIETCGLKLYVVDPKSPSELDRHFTSGGHWYARNIMNGLGGYFPHRLRDVLLTSRLRELEQLLA
jgi:hypothetical protein